jgi:hypothetical protein
LNPPPDLSQWSAASTETALRELYAFYGRTHRMYESLFRDETLVATVARRLRDFYGYLDAARDALMAGRGLRGSAARRTRAAIGHALAFTTWQSLIEEQRLTDADAVSLMSQLIETASRR